MSATCIIAFEWIVVFLTHGLKSSLMPAFGDNFSSVVGTVMFNYAFITAVPSWINAKVEIRLILILSIQHPSIDIKRSIWRSIFTATLLYMSVGIFGLCADVYNQV